MVDKLLEALEKELPFELVTLANENRIHALKSSKDLAGSYLAIVWHRRKHKNNPKKQVIVTPRKLSTLMGVSPSYAWQLLERLLPFGLKKKKEGGKAHYEVKDDFPIPLLIKAAAEKMELKRTIKIAEGGKI